MAGHTLLRYIELDSYSFTWNRWAERERKGAMLRAPTGVGKSGNLSEKGEGEGLAST